MQGKVEQSTDGTVDAGIDVSKAGLDIALWPVDIRFRVANTKKGHKELLDKLRGLRVTRIVIEATGKYHLGVCQRLEAAGHGVAIVNPYRARRFADMLGQLAKTDTIDAMMLARFGRMAELEPTPLASQNLLELKELLHARQAARGERTALANRRSSTLNVALARKLDGLIHVLDAHINWLDREIKTVIADDPVLQHRFDILVSIPGVGFVTAASMIGFMPELGTMTGQRGDARTSRHQGGTRRPA
ncbi:MAG: IS110 family transposase [Hyphomicrobiaceae bacterium]